MNDDTPAAPDVPSSGEQSPSVPLPPAEEHLVGTPASTGSPLATASLVVGIVGLLTFWAFGLGALLGLVAVVLGVVALRDAAGDPRSPHRGAAVGGIVTGAVAVAIGLLTLSAMLLVSGDRQNSDPVDGVCNTRRFVEDPDC